MKNSLKIFIVTLICLTICGNAQARHARGTAALPPLDPTIGVLPSYNDVYSNWKNAGLLSLGGIPNRTTQCGSTVAISGGDDSSNINAAIAACPPGDYVQLAAGTVSNITASISGTTLTITSGSGETAGNVIGDAGGKVLPNTRIVSGSGNTWTLSIPQTVSSETMWSVVPFQITQSEYIALNKGVTLRGSGSPISSCASVCWPTVLSVTNGAIPDWSISSTTTGGNCGSSASSTAGCSASTGVILMSPSTNFNWGWAGCFLSTAPTGCGTTLTADIAQGATSVAVTSTTNFSVGMWVLIDENPAAVSIANPTGGASLQASPEFLNTTGTPAVMRMEGGDGDSPYSFAPNRVNAEIHQIAGIGSAQCPGGTSTTICFTDPVTTAFRQSGSHDARLYWPTVQGSAANPFLSQAGVENLTILGAGNGGIQVTFCAYCWVRNVEVGGWIAGAVDFSYSVRGQVEGSYFHTGDDLENNGNEYSLAIMAASTEIYVDNNIILYGGKGMVGRASCCSVIAGNYIDDTLYMAASIGDYWLDMSLNGSHYAGTHYWLFELNWANNCDDDETHGAAGYHTYAFNQCSGVRTTFIDPSNGKTVNDTTGSCWGNASVSAVCGPERAAGPMALNYWDAYVGNVLGLTGTTTTGNGWVYRGAFCGGGTCTGGFVQNKAIWMSGWAGGEEPSTDPNLTTTSNPFLFRHGNYDYVNAAINDWATGYSHTLPTSFYTLTEPAFYLSGTTATYPYPWVTPTAGTPIQLNSLGGPGLPAKARWAAGTPFVQP